MVVSTVGTTAHGDEFDKKLLIKRVDRCLDFLIDYAGGKALDKVLGLDDSQRYQELDNRLRIAEDNFRAINSRHAESIAELRRQITESTSKERIREIVNAALDDLKSEIESHRREIENQRREMENQKRDITNHISGVEQRANLLMSTIESRTESVEQRTRRLEADHAAFVKKQTECFEYVPRIAPSINFSSFESAFVAEPVKDELLKDYLDLLVLSEDSLNQLGILSELEKPESPRMKKALARDEALAIEAMDLHLAAKSNLAMKVLDRRELQREVTDKNPRLRDADIRMSAATWLVARTLPEKSAFGYHLTIPKNLFTADGGTILASYQLVGGKPSTLSPLFVRHFKTEAERTMQGTLNIRPTEAPDESNSPYRDSRNQFQSAANKLMARSMNLLLRVWLTETKQRSIADSLEELHPTVVANRAAKKQLLTEAQRLHSEVDQSLARGTSGYLTTLVFEKWGAPEQSKFREQVLGKLAVAALILECHDWESPTALDSTWGRMVSAAQNVFIDSNLSRLTPPEEFCFVPQLPDAFGQSKKGASDRLRIAHSNTCQVFADPASGKIVLKPLIENVPEVTTDFEAVDSRCIQPLGSAIALCDRWGNLDIVGYTGKVKIGGIQLPKPARRMAVSANSSYVASLSDEGRVSLVSLVSKREVLWLPLEYRDAEISLEEEDGRIRKIVLWDTKLKTPRPILALNAEAVALAFAP
ncbi:MAG: hypothetical protein U0892_22050 [Pirellulales bacterium]